ncbi:heat shock 70 kDa protein 14-like [Homalodisca vitripennis]|uniref:heat shock 70 kDa protein 14-like n=1 Tax=Homalodisca vitripennis TaxID=197043 RepID=UPI001EEBB378|nr:heat shock 70 kDa protein 14-like [Homalodisca vitripennis]
MNPVFGIHVGNTSVCLAICKVKFHVDIVAGTDGERVMPAIVTVTEKEMVVGSVCKSLIASSWKTTVMCNKMMVNSNEPYAVGDRKHNVTIVFKKNELHYCLPLKKKTELLTPKDIYTCIYKSLYEALVGTERLEENPTLPLTPLRSILQPFSRASSRQHKARRHEIDNLSPRTREGSVPIAKNTVPGVKGKLSCVLMFPKHFSEAAKLKMKIAAKAAYWNVLQIIHEPSAVILGYNLLSGKKPLPSQIVLVYRAGGQTCDASVIDLAYGLITLLDTEHSKAVGGRVLISTLTKYLANDFYRIYGIDPQKNHRSMTKLTLAAEEFLRLLSSEENATFFLESLCEGVDFCHVMSRARLESLLHPFLPTFAEPLHTVLTRLKMTPDSVSTLLLCGGLLKIPRLRKFISDIFKESCVNIVYLPKGVNYDEIMACGAARQGGYNVLFKRQNHGVAGSSNKVVHSSLPSEVPIPILSSSLTIWVEGAVSESIELMSGHPLPFQRTLVLTSCDELVTITAIQMECDQIMLRGQGMVCKTSKGNPK